MCHWDHSWLDRTQLHSLSPVLRLSCPHPLPRTIPHRRALQATWDVTVEAAEGWSVRGNMPLKSSTREPARKMVAHSFDRTPVMSSYLVAFMVGEMVEETAGCELMQGPINMTSFAVSYG